MEIIEQEFVEAPSGIYEVCFLEFFHDSEKRPLLPEVIEWGEEEVELLRFRMKVLAGDLEGSSISASVRIGERACAWFRIFGCPEELASRLRRTPSQELLTRIEDFLESEAKPVTVFVGERGWIVNIVPPDSTYIVRFTTMTPRDEFNKPYFKEEFIQRRGRSWTERRFTIWLEIMRGKLKGLRLPAVFRYVVRYDERRKVLTINRGSKWGSAFLNLLDAFDIEPETLSAETVEDPRNILPELEKLLRAKKEPVLVVVRDGFVQPSSFAKLPAEIPLASPRLLILSKVENYCQDGVKEGRLTEKGKSWLKEEILPLAKELGLPTKLSQYSVSEIELLFSEWEERELKKWEDELPF